MSKTKMVKVVIGVWALLFVYSAVSSDLAKHVIAEEISGVVVDKETGKPIPNAVVAMRFERGNTGHSSPHCFRSIAVQGDEQGRFKFAPWSQENTKANNFYGELVVHKPGYKVRPSEPLYIHQSSREFLGIRYSNDIRIPKTELRVELSPWGGMDEERRDQIRHIAVNFSCTWHAFNDSLILLENILGELCLNPTARLGSSPSRSSAIESIEEDVASLRYGIRSDIDPGPDKRKEWVKRLRASTGGQCQ